MMFLGFTLLAATLSYGIWTQTRTDFLILEISRIRSNLFNVVSSMPVEEWRDNFTQPAYKLAERRLTCIINTAQYLSIPVTRYTLTNDVKDCPEEMSEILKFESRHSNHEIALAIDKSKQDCVKMITKYLIFYTATGLIFLVWSFCRMRLKKFLAETESTAEQWYDQFGFERLFKAAENSYTARYPSLE